MSSEPRTRKGASSRALRVADAEHLAERDVGRFDPRFRLDQVGLLVDEGDLGAVDVDLADAPGGEAVGLVLELRGQQVDGLLAHADVGLGVERGVKRRPHGEGRGVQGGLEFERGGAGLELAGVNAFAHRASGIQVLGKAHVADVILIAELGLVAALGGDVLVAVLVVAVGGQRGIDGSLGNGDRGTDGIGVFGGGEHVGILPGGEFHAFRERVGGGVRRHGAAGGQRGPQPERARHGHDPPGGTRSAAGGKVVSHGESPIAFRGGGWMGQA